MIEEAYEYSAVSLSTHVAPLPSAPVLSGTDSRRPPTTPLHKCLEDGFGEYGVSVLSAFCHGTA